MRKINRIPNIIENFCVENNIHFKYFNQNDTYEDMSNAPHMSKWSVSNDDEPEINENNSYLHDNID